MMNSPVSVIWENSSAELERARAWNAYIANLSKQAQNPYDEDGRWDADLESIII